MDQPVYVIKSVESVWTYKYNGKIYDVLKKVVWTFFKTSYILQKRWSGFW